MPASNAQLMKNMSPVDSRVTNLITGIISVTIILLISITQCRFKDVRVENTISGGGTRLETSILLMTFKLSIISEITLFLGSPRALPSLHSRPGESVGNMVPGYGYVIIAYDGVPVVGTAVLIMSSLTQSVAQHALRRN